MRLGRGPKNIIYRLHDRPLRSRQSHMSSFALCIVLLSLLLPYLASPLSRAQLSLNSQSRISFEPSNIPFLNATYEGATFKFTLNGHYVRVIPYVVFNGSIVKISNFVSVNPTVGYSYLMDKRNDLLLNYGFNLTAIPQRVADRVELITFILETDLPDRDLFHEVLSYELPKEKMTGELTEIHRLKIPILGLTFSFEDLLTLGYSVEHKNKTRIDVGSVTGKTDLNLDPVVYSSNTITITGYTSATPCYYNDLYNADQNGERCLMTSRAEAMDQTLDTQIKPCSDLSLKLRLVITSYVKSGTTTLTGTDKDGGSQTESISITGNGNYSSTKWYKTINSGGIDTTHSGSGDAYYIAIYQLQWGVVYKESDFLFQFDAKIQIGDGSTMTYFGPETLIRSVVVRSVFASNYDYFIIVKNYAVFTVGTLVSSTYRTGTSGGQIFLSESSPHYYCSAITSDHTNATVYLYGLQILGKSGYDTYGVRLKDGSTKTRLYDVYTDHCNMEGTYNASRLTVIRNRSYGFQNASGTWDNVTIHSPVTDAYAFWINRASGGNISNVNVVSCSETSILAFYLTKDYHMIDVVMRSHKAFFSGTTSTNYGELYRDYTLKVRTILPDGSYLSGANVSLSYSGNATTGISPGTVGSWTTDSNGQIPTLTLIKEFRNKTGGYTPYSYGTYNITIVKEGYVTYTRLFTQISPESWTIPMLTATEGGAVEEGPNLLPIGLLLGLCVGLPILALVFLKKK